ncbi:MAG: DUF928 domain-containing protein, partial [Pedobacter sp.]|nr:DUF928 domain-containing protein [Pedobacter sp.]
MKRVILLIISCCMGLAATAQVSIQFVPEVFGKSIDGLMNASIVSMQSKRNVRLNVTVTEARAGKVLTIQTQPFVLVPGNNIIPSTVIRSAKVAMSGNAIGNYIRQNQAFPLGSYEYNYVLISAASSEEILVEQSFNQDLTPPAPLELIEPFKDDKICEKRPLLTWQPSLPLINGQLYSLTLVEIKEKQNAVEALNYNLPIVNQKGIMNNVLMYPPISKELVEGKTYAWQVTAYKDKTVINRSEVWAFTVKCEDTLANVVEVDDGFRDIEDLARGNYYVAKSTVKFALVNSYAEQPLTYTITCITDPTQKIRSLPKLKLQRGNNKMKIDLSRNHAFKDNYSYLLSV